MCLSKKFTSAGAFVAALESFYRDCRMFKDVAQCQLKLVLIMVDITREELSQQDNQPNVSSSQSALPVEDGFLSFTSDYAFFCTASSGHSQCCFCCFSDVPFSFNLKAFSTSQGNQPSSKNSKEIPVYQWDSNRTEDQHIKHNLHSTAA